MKKRLLLVLFVLFVPVVMFSKQDVTSSQPLAAYKLGTVWYFIGYDGKELFSPIELYNVVGYNDGMYCISQKINGREKWGFLDSTGKICIEPQYDLATNFSEGFAVIYEFQSGGESPILFNFIDKNGKKLLDQGLISAISFSEGLAFAMLPNRESGYINTKGEFVLKFKELNGESFSNGLAAIANETLRFGFIDKNGNQKIDYLYETVGKYSEELVSVFINQQFGFIDSNGTVKIEPKFDYAHPFIEGRAFVGILYNENAITRWAVIDTSGLLLTEYSFPQVWDFSEGLAAVRDTKKWGFIDKSGKFAIQPEYFYTASFINGLAWASKKEEKEFGYINKNAEYIVKLPEFDRAIDLRLNKRVY